MWVFVFFSPPPPPPPGIGQVSTAGPSVNTSSPLLSASPLSQVPPGLLYPMLPMTKLKGGADSIKKSTGAFLLWLLSSSAVYCLREVCLQSQFRFWAKVLVFETCVRSMHLRSASVIIECMAVEDGGRLVLLIDLVIMTYSGLKTNKMWLLNLRVTYPSSSARVFWLLKLQLKWEIFHNYSNYSGWVKLLMVQSFTVPLVCVTLNKLHNDYNYIVITYTIYVSF